MTPASAIRHPVGIDQIQDNRLIRERTDEINVHRQMNHSCDTAENFLQIRCWISILLGSFSPESGAISFGTYETGFPGFIRLTSATLCDEKDHKRSGKPARRKRGDIPIDFQGIEALNDDVDILHALGLRLSMNSRPRDLPTSTQREI